MSWMLWIGRFVLHLRANHVDLNLNIVISLSTHVTHAIHLPHVMYAMSCVPMLYHVYHDMHAMSCLPMLHHALSCHPYNLMSTMPCMLSHVCPCYIMFTMSCMLSHSPFMLSYRISSFTWKFGSTLSTEINVDTWVIDKRKGFQWSCCSPGNHSFSVNTM